MGLTTPKNYRYPLGSRPYLIHGSWGPRESPPNRISIGSVAVAGLTNVNNRQTDRHTHRLCYIVYRNKPHLHCVTKNLSTFYFLNKSVKYLPILMLFATWNPQKIWHQKRICLPTLPVSCSHFTFGSSKKSISTLLLIRNSDYLRYLWIKRTVTVNVDLPTTSKKCHPTTLWTWSSDWRCKLIVFLQMLVALKTTGCDVWQLECQANN